MTCPRRFLPSRSPGRCSVARPPSASSIRISPVRSPISRRSSRELKAELLDRPEPTPETPPEPRQAAELGDLLFAAVNVARRLNADPELELRAATARFRSRVEEAERRAAAAGENWLELPLAEQDRYFDLAKETE